MPMPDFAVLPNNVAWPTNGVLPSNGLLPNGDGKLPASPHAAFGAELIDGLRRPHHKEIASSWLYDPVGSALFEAITLLPEYGLTRADERLIASAAAELVRILGPSPFLAELGSGSGRKTRNILQAFLSAGPLHYAPIDVSPAALESCILPYRETAGLHLLPTAGDYLSGLAIALAERRAGQRALVLFLGSTVGNFPRETLPTFFGQVRSLLRHGDALLLGADLEKAPHVLELAYDDPAGVTAAFNKNLLAHINRLFDGDFDLRLFRHVAFYNSTFRRIEMYLESLAAQSVRIAALELQVELRQGERIRTELCNKFSLPELHSLAGSARFSPERHWVDAEWPFAECLWMAR